jgi:nitrite reductase/ring-hydroxylating ferredoxin subunit
MTKFLVGKVSDLTEGSMTHVTAGGKEVLIANVKGNFYAMGNICTHAGAELHEGELNGNELKCPWHGAKWDITTGNLIWFPQQLKSPGSYQVIVENEMIYVDVH